MKHLTLDDLVKLNEEENDFIINRMIAHWKKGHKDIESWCCNENISYIFCMRYSKISPWRYRCSYYSKDKDNEDNEVFC